MTKDQEKQRVDAIRRASGVCIVCGKPLSLGQPQYAHRIANTDTNRKKWGSRIIDHTLNGDYVCSLECNQVLNIGNNPGECWRLVKAIAEFEIRKY